MAGDWIKMRTDLRTSQNVVRISSALNADRLRVIGGLHAVWSLFDTHSADGCLDGYTTEVLDDEIRWPGFSAAMIAVGWLLDDAGSLSVPRFDEHNGQSAKRRAQESDRKRIVRKMSASDADVDADKKRTREEKRREEKIEDQKQEGAAAPAGEADHVVEEAKPKVDPKFDPKAALVAEGVEPQQAADFLQIRKAKKAPLTLTALEGIKREALKAGLDLAGAVALCCVRGWQGFKAEWVTDQRGQQQARPNGRPSINAVADLGADDPFNNFRRV